MKRIVVHLITGLAKGGAETMLYQLLKYRTDSKLQYRVVSLGASHYYEKPMRELGYDVIELDVRNRPFRSFFRLCRELDGADTLCCWMYHANLIGYLAGRMAGVKTIIWCIRHSDLDPAHNKPMTLRINRLCARWSRRVDLVIYNGKRAREAHEAIGYWPKNGYVADNGCDCVEYKPDAGAADSLRAELNIPSVKKIVLSVTKATPIKDVPTFLKALGILRKQKKDFAAVLCGSGVNPDNGDITALCAENGLVVGNDIFLLDLRHDVPRLLAACDLYVLHSAGEAFPNTLIQAMACGCVCVATDVGDVRRILSNDDCIVPSGEADVLAAKMAEMLALPADKADALRRANRERTQVEFDIHEIVKTYEGVVLENVAHRNGREVHSE